MGTRMLMQFTVVAMVLTALMMVEEVKSIPICNVDTNDLEKCRSAVTGKTPPPPGPDCCAVVKAADIPCGCTYKRYLKSFGIEPSNVKAVLVRCGVTVPSCLRA